MLLERLFEDLHLTLQAFAVCEVAQGWRLRLGRQGWVTVHFVLSGHGRLRAGDQVLPLPPRSLVLVPSDRAHSIEAGAPIEHESTPVGTTLREGGLEVLAAGPHEDDQLLVACAHVRAEYDTGLGLFDGLELPVSLDFSDSPEMVSVFERLLTEERQRSSTSGAMMTALMNEVIILLFRRLCAEPDCPLPWLSALEDPRFSPVISSMLEHPEQAHSLDSLAATALMSRSAFSVAFGERFGRSPMAFLRALRMRRAGRLLRGSSFTVDQVARRVGYSSRSHFSRAFAAEFGGSPSAFRRAPGTRAP